MADALKWVVGIVAVLAAVTAIGVTIEVSRRRHIRAFVQKHGGTFEPGTIMQGAPVPEGAPFDAWFERNPGGDVVGSAPPDDETITYRNVVRVRGDEASYVIALRSESRRDTKDELKSTSSLVCFVTLARSDLPQVHVFPAMKRVAWMDALLGSVPPAPVELPGVTPEFAKEFSVYPVPGTAAPTPEALDRLLDRTVQAELLARRKLVAGLDVRGNVVRIQAVNHAGDQPHEELYEASRKLAIIWAGKRRL